MTDTHGQSICQLRTERDYARAEVERLLIENEKLGRSAFDSAGIVHDIKGHRDSLLKQLALAQETIAQFVHGEDHPDQYVTKEEAAQLKKLIRIFARKGRYHMEQWPGDKEMNAAIESAEALVPAR